MGSRAEVEMVVAAYRATASRLSTLGCLVLACCVLWATALMAQPCGTASPSASPFPLHVEPGKRYLVDAAGAPFFMQGDSPWSLIAQLNRNDVELYLRDRKARGFNTLLVNLLEHRFAEKAPANIFGDKPFMVDGDYSTPNEAYFRHADWVLQRACEMGFLVLLAPSYVGSGGGGDGWYQEMLHNSPETLAEYGRFVARRYAGLGNILWVQGGDYSVPDKNLVRAIANGIREIDPTALQTAHNTTETSALDYWAGEPWLTVNSIFPYVRIERSALGQYALSDMPFFLIESIYENEYDADEQQVRMQAYQAILSGASGHVFGNNPIWHFDGPGLFAAPMGWKQALDSPGARSMSVLHDLFSSIEWWKLKPDIDGSLVVDGKGGEKARVVGAIAEDRSLALIYLPTSKDVTVDLGQFGGRQLVARWRDPSNGQAVAVEGGPFAGGRHSFKPPRRNQDGYTDWLLELAAVEQSQ